MWSEVVNWRTNNATTKRKINKEKRRKNVCKALHGKLKIEQHEPTKNRRWIHVLPEEQTVPAPLIARVKKSTVSHGWGKKKGIVNLSVVTYDWDIPNGYYNQVMKATIKFSKHWLVFTNRNLWFGILAEDGHFENCISCQWWN